MFLGRGEPGAGGADAEMGGADRLPGVGLVDPGLRAGIDVQRDAAFEADARRVPARCRRRSGGCGR